MIGGALSTSDQKPARRTAAKPRLGFLGVGWIGRNRMEAIVRSGLAEVVGIADAVEANALEAAKLVPEAYRVSNLDQLLEMDLDGVVIATPSALHAEQAITATEAGLAVFCQKPLARTAAETQRVIDAARTSDRLLAVDLSYRFTSGIERIKGIVERGELGKIFAANLIFHNAYGPDKAWFYDYKLSGGGCVIDLGIHLVDLIFWVVGLECKSVTSRLFQQGELLKTGGEKVEDFAQVQLDLENGGSVQLSCSWKLPAGCDAIIAASFYGTGGGVEFKNVNGSFFEFKAERFYGTKREVLASGQEEWGGRAAVDWLERVAEGRRYDPSVEKLINVAVTLDRIYGRL